jgi:hypothetical protein
MQRAAPGSTMCAMQAPLRWSHTATLPSCRPSRHATGGGGASAECGVCVLR